jgi:hypothetical protein
MDTLFATPEVYYCEEPLYGSYFEPLNTLSNAAVIGASLRFRRKLRMAGAEDGRFQVFLVLLMVFGLGSAAWHTVPTFFTWVLDVLPVSLFFVYFIYFLHLRLLPNARLGRRWFIVFLLWSVAMTLVLQRAFDGRLNGAETYIAQISFLGGVGVYACARRHPSARWVFAVCGMFLVQLCFRQFDGAFCAQWPYGLHFLWHLTGSVTIYLALWIMYFSELREPQHPG